MNESEPTVPPVRRRGRPKRKVSKPQPFPDTYQWAIRLFLLYNAREAQAGLDAARRTMARIGRNSQSLGQIRHYGGLLDYLQFLDGRVPHKWKSIRYVDDHITFDYQEDETP